MNGQICPKHVYYVNVVSIDGKSYLDTSLFVSKPISDTELLGLLGEKFDDSIITPANILFLSSS